MLPLRSDFLIGVNIALIINFLLLSTRIATAEEINPPKLTLDDLNQLQLDNSDWTFINLTDGSPALFSERKSTLELNCVAPYPIQWTISGTIMPPDFVKFQPHNRTINNTSKPLYQIRLIIFFTPTIKNCLSSALISCHKIDASNVSSSYAVFVPGDKPLLNSGHSSTILTSTSNDTMLIPCPTTNPSVPVSLYKVSNNGNFEKMEDQQIIYNEVTGFRLPKFVEGRFVCSTGPGFEDNVTVISPFTNVQQEIKSFVGDPIEITCSTHLGLGESVAFKFVNPDDDGKYVVDVDKISHRLLNLRVKSQSPGNGTLLCYEKRTEHIVQNWDFEFVKPPELYLDNFEGEVDCLSDYDDRSVSTVRCTNPSHCEYMKHCFQNPGFCNYKGQKKFHSDIAGRCWVQKRKSGASCAFVPYSHLNGIAECKVRGITKHFMFFAALNYRRYASWEDVAKSDLIRLESKSTKDQTEFLCEASAFLFADSLKFSIQFKNGTETFLDESSYIIPNSEHPLKMDEFNVLGHLIMTKPISSDILALKCHAPWWNSTEFMTTEIKFSDGMAVANNCVM